MVDQTKVDNYFNNRFNSDALSNIFDDERDLAVNMAENLIKSMFTLRPNAEETDSYLYAVCEQAYHLISFSKERWKLQQEGVRSYRVEDMQIDMEASMISPMAKIMLKPIIYRQAGDIV